MREALDATAAPLATEPVLKLIDPAVSAQLVENDHVSGVYEVVDIVDG